MAKKKKQEEPQVEEALGEALSAATTRTIGARPNTDANIVIQLLMGLVGTVVVSLAVLPLKQTGIGGLVYINGVINERGPVQYGELYMAFMMSMMLYQKARIIKGQLGSIADGPVPSDIDFTDDEQLSNLRQRISERDDVSWSIVASRTDRLLGLWLNCKDVGRVSSALSSESARDASAADSSYANARVLIWAIPILGFIGTVLGLGVAVAQFSDFLAGAADLSSIKDAIGGVTGGLGVAFDTTLLALLLSVFLMFPMTSIQRKEENFFVEVDNYIDDTAVSRLPSAQQQPVVIENLEDSIEAAFRRYIPDPDRYDEVFTRSIEKAASSVAERFSGLTQHYEATLRDMTGRLSENLSAVGDSMQVALKQAVSELRQQDEQLINSRKQIAQDETNRLKGMLQEVQETAMRVSSEYQRSAEVIQAKTQEGLDKSLAAARDITGRMEQVGKLAASIEDLLRIEQAVEKSLQGLAASDDFRRTLTEIRNHLANTDAFCDRLSRPRIITLEEEVV